MDDKLRKLRQAMDKTTHKGSHFTEKNKENVRKKILMSNGHSHKRRRRFPLMIYGAGAAAVLIFALLITTEMLGTDNSLSLQEDEAEFDLEGRNLGLRGEEGLVVFVEDNYGGDRVLPFSEEAEVPSDYEVEAYKLRLTEDTVIKNDEGEEVTLAESDLMVMLGMRLEVTVEEEFSPEVSSNLPAYISHGSEFLPVYNAEKIQMLEPNMDDFTHFVTSFGMHRNARGSDDYLIVLTGGDHDKTVMFNTKDYDEQLEPFRSSTRNITVANSAFYSFTLLDGRSVSLQEMLRSFQLPEELVEEPTFLIYDTEGFVTDINDWEEVLDYFEENIN